MARFRTLPALVVLLALVPPAVAGGSGAGMAGTGADAMDDPGCGAVLAPVDQAGLPDPRPGDQNADHRSDGADGRHEQREHQAVFAEGGLAQGERGDQGHRVGLEQVGGHAGAVADVVADVVGDGRRVAGVVLGDPDLDLADQVGTDVSGLGEDAAADPHEHRQQGGAEAEALQHRGGVAPVEDHDDSRAQQAETDGGHPDHPTGPDGDPHPGVPATGAAGGCRDPDVGTDGQGHAEVADRGREQGTHDEEDAPADLDVQIAGQGEEQEEDEDDEPAQSAELPVQVRLRPLLDGAGDLLHLLGALVRNQYLGAEQPCRRETDHGDRRNNGDKGQVPSGQGHLPATLSGNHARAHPVVLLDNDVLIRPHRTLPGAMAVLLRCARRTPSPATPVLGRRGVYGTRS